VAPPPPESPSRWWSVALDLAYLTALPFLAVYLLIVSRALTRPKYRRGLWAKLGGGLDRRRGAEPSLWFHAVSVGEVITALPLIEALRRRLAGWDLRVSVSTFTGFEVARKSLPDLPVFYFPLDFSPVVRRFLRALRPAAVILLELELWPNFLLEAARRGVPVLVVNGRITARSARRYAWGRGLTRHFFGLASSFGVQNETYRQRLAALGVVPERIEVLGNLKYDAAPSPGSARGIEVRASLGWPPGETLVLVAGSTHTGEEEALCDVYAATRAADPRLRLVLAPRHVERLTAGELSSWQAPEPLQRWSQSRGEEAAPLPERRILVVDTLGELELFYSLADVVFVGGSLIPHGGHNLLEPARLGKPILFGPHYHNFQEIGDLLLGEAGAIRVAGKAELEGAIERLLRDPEERSRLGKNALDLSQGLRGAVDRYSKWVEAQLRLYLGRTSC